MCLFRTLDHSLHRRLQFPVLRHSPLSTDGTLSFPPFTGSMFTASEHHLLPFTTIYYLWTRTVSDAVVREMCSTHLLLNILCSVGVLECGKLSPIFVKLIFKLLHILDNQTKLCRMFNVFYIKYWLMSFLDEVADFRSILLLTCSPQMVNKELNGELPLTRKVVNV